MSNFGTNGDPSDHGNVPPLTESSFSDESVAGLSDDYKLDALPLSTSFTETPLPFSNEIVDTTVLPVLEGEAFQLVHPNYLKARWIGDAIFAAVVLIAAGVALAVAPVSPWIPTLAAGALLVLTALSAVIQKVEIGRLGYLVRERDFSFRQGVLFSSVKTMPYARVQHVSIDRGPVERMFGLATLTMKSAGGDVVVGGLPPEVADRLKALVVDRSGASADSELAYGAGTEPSDQPPEGPPLFSDSAESL